MRKVNLAILLLSSTATFAAPQLILDSDRLDFVTFTQVKRELNSGWRKERTSYVRPFNRVNAGIVRYGAAVALPPDVTAKVRFVDAEGGVLHEETARGGVTNLLRGAFEQEGTLAAVRIEPSKPVGPKGLFAKPFRVTVGWAVDECFAYGPFGWRGKDAKVVDLPYSGCAVKDGKKGFDRPCTDAVLEIGPGGFADPGGESRWLTSAYVFEFDALAASGCDFAAAGVRLRDHYDLVSDVWYHFRYEVAGGRARIKLNGREVAKGVPVNGLVIENRSKAVALLVDDVRAYAQENPLDYPSAPVRPRGEERWDVLLNVCPLWHNGYHAGWQCIEQGHGPRLALGYYDEGLPETADWEIKYMVEHGIDVQLFCWYPESHDGPIRHPRYETHLQDGFKNARYSDRMKYALIWEIQNAGRPHSLEAWKRNYVPYLIEHHFKDPRYYAPDGRPLLAVFGGWNFPDRTSFGSAAATKEAFGYLEGELKKLGFKGLIVVSSNWNGAGEELSACGFTARAPYNYGTDGWKIETQKARNLARAAIPGAFAIPSVSVGYNSEPWHGTRYPMMSPADFKTALTWIRDEFIPAQPHKTPWEERVVLLSTWNEYGEGTYLMPTEDERGFGYLDAVRAVFTDEKPQTALNVRPTVAQRRRICNLYPQDFAPDR